MSQKRNKPKVGIVYSQTDKFSCESMNLAYYLSGLLSKSGYSDIYMISYESDATQYSTVNSKRIKYIPPRESIPKEVPGMINTDFYTLCC